jgi:hypothetical protein
MSTSPVFVVGSARSGNTLLYDYLLSSGNFVVYRTEPAAFDLLAPKFGSLSKPGNRKRFVEAWLRSYQFRLSGLDRNVMENRILGECRSYGEFLRVVMTEIARKQRVERWAVWGPNNLLHIPAIAHDLPDALFVHMIRDGRDVALSLGKEGWSPFFWDSGRAMLVGGLHWKWKVEQGRNYAKRIPPRYLEVHFEDLATRPQETLTKIGAFIGQDLKYADIVRTGVGTLINPNATFRNDIAPSSPVGRWRRYLSPTDVPNLESVIGDLLQELGYPLTFPRSLSKSFQIRIMQELYPKYFSAKEWSRSRTLLGRLVSTGRLRFDDEPARPCGEHTHENQSGLSNA